MTGASYGDSRSSLEPIRIRRTFFSHDTTGCVLCEHSIGRMHLDSLDTLTSIIFISLIHTKRKLESKGDVIRLNAQFESVVWILRRAISGRDFLDLEIEGSLIGAFSDRSPTFDRDRERCRRNLIERFDSR